MAKTKAVLALLATAQAIFEVNQDERLKASIAELEALEDATHSTTEYKNLKDIVDELEQNTGDDKSNIGKGKNENNDDLNSNKDENNTGEQNTGDDKIVEKPKKLNYTGIKMIGNKWYSVKDKYKKSFATADECAKHFN